MANKEKPAQDVQEAIEESVYQIQRKQQPEYSEICKAIGKAAVDEIGIDRLNSLLKSIIEPVEELQAYIEKHPEIAEYLKQVDDAVSDFRALTPFFEDALKQLQEEHPEFKGLTVKQITRNIDAQGNPLTDESEMLLVRAKQIRDSLIQLKGQAEKTVTAIRRYMSKLPDCTEYPLDKISKNWTVLADFPEGQLFATERRGSKKEASVFAKINFDELPDTLSITKRLTPFDKRVYIAVSALYNAGNEVVSAGMIYSQMGNNGKPNKDNIQKINDSLTKMVKTHLTINNKDEIQVNKGYKEFPYDAPLLPFERLSAYINNQLVETAIHLFREPPLMTFAKDRKQITTISRELLNSPLSKTDANIQLEDYIFEQISHMKNGKMSTRILLKTIYQKCEITEKKQKQRAPEKIKRILDHYKAKELIAGYSFEDDGINIYLARKSEQKAIK